MLSRISSEPLMSISSKHSYKTFSKSPSAFGKWRNSLTMVALSFTIVKYLFTNIS